MECSDLFASNISLPAQLVDKNEVLEGFILLRRQKGRHQCSGGGIPYKKDGGGSLKS